MANFQLGVQVNNFNSKVGKNKNDSSPVELKQNLSDFKSDSSNEVSSSKIDLLTSFEEDEMTLAPVKPKDFLSRPKYVTPSSLPSTPNLARRHTAPTSSTIGLLPNNMTYSNNVNNNRHYKKDTPFVYDLYTLTFDEDQTLDDLETANKKATDYLATAENYGRFCSLNPAFSSLAFSSVSEFNGPVSLGSNYSKPISLPSLETNLHKILARKIQDSEEVSFKKAKLLTKAYYKLLRESTTPIIDPQLLIQYHRDKAAKPIGQNRLSWQSLLQTEPTELKRIVSGLQNTVKVLNDLLMDLLEERDDLLGRQDGMLEEISELTDTLL